MRRDVLVVLAVVVTASILFAPCALDDVSSAKEEPDPLPVTTFTVYGYISNISDHDKNVPLGDVSVSLLNKDESLIEETVTSEDGRFEFTYDLNDCDPGYIFFDLPGYTPRALPDSMEFTDDANTVSFDISEITPDEDGKYPLSGDCYSGKAVGMAITNGKLFGTVYGINGNNTFEVEGSTVTAISANGVRYTASTNSSGYFEMTVPYGTYDISATCSGFQSSETIHVSTSEASAITITMQENEFGIEFLGGIDAPHALLAISVALIAIALVISLAIVHRSRTEGSEIVVINDLEPLDDDEDDSIEHP